jgi:type IV pilus assembly protein PilF
VLLDQPLEDSLRRDARQLLLEMYDKALYNSEAIALADQVLANDPSNLAALKYKANAMLRLRDYPGALGVARKRAELSPLDLEAQLQVLDLLFLDKTPEDQIIEHATALQKEHPDDPRFELLLGVAYGMCNDEGQARTWLRMAASRKAPDAEFITALIQYFDNLKLFDESQAVLEKADIETNTPEIRRVLIQRLWQSGRNAEVVKRLENLDPANPNSDVKLLALKALSLHRLNRVAEANAIVEALGLRSTDSDAQAWAQAIRARYAQPPLEPKAMVEQVRAALMRDSSNAQIRFMLGEAYAQLGEEELALQAWRETANNAPSWSLPRVLIANTMSSTGRTETAMNEAMAGHRAAPSASTAIAFAVAWFARVEETGDAADAAKLIAFVKEIQDKIPGEPTTLPIYASLLARSGKPDEARKVIDSALAGKLDIPQDALLRLAVVSREYDLGLEAGIFEQTEKAYGLTPSLAYARAADLAAEGKVADGLKYLQTAADNASVDPLSWKLAIAQYKDVVHDSTAVDAWRALGDGNPDNLRVQNLVLEFQHATAAWQDREFIKRSVERLKNLTGPDGMKWKLAHARWLLGEGSDRDRAEAVNLLTDLVRTSPGLLRPRLLLAQALEQVGNRARAIDELKIAYDQNPSSSEVAFTLARLLQAEGKMDESRKYLLRLTKNTSLQPAANRRLAEMLVQHGEIAAAIGVLTLNGPVPDEAESRLLLADLYRRNGQPDQAASLYDTLLAETNPSIMALQHAAESYATQGEFDLAQKALDRIDQSPQPAFEKHLAKAEYNERFASADDTVVEYKAAINAAPSDDRTWKGLIGYYLRQGKFSDAASSAADAVKAVPGNGTLQTLRDQSAALAQSNQPEDVQQLARIMAQDPSNPAAAAALESMRQAAADGESAEQRVARLRDLSSKYPRFLPAQIMLAEGYLSLGKAAEALSVATQAMQQFPNDSAAAQLAMRVYAANQKWDDMLIAAQSWRARSLDQPLQADLVIAEALLRLQRPDDAIAQLAPYISSANTDPRGNFATLIFYGRALLMAGRESEAAELLLPMTKDSAEWRDAWLSILAAANRTAENATTWIQRLAPSVPANQQFNLASAWYNVSQQFGENSGFEKARDVLSPLIQQPEPDLAAVMLYASASEQLGDLPSAEQAYRKAMAIDPSVSVVKNNLAYVILLRGGDLSEARTLASDAIKQSPDIAGFHDTLARILVKTGDTEGAIDQFESARKLQPNNLESLIGLADVLSQTGQRDRAVLILREINSLMNTNSTLPPAIQEQLDSVRSALSS